MMQTYLSFWNTNGNIAFIWHAVTLIAVCLIVGMILFGNRKDVERDRLRNLDRHHPDDEVLENFEQHRKR